MEKEHAEKGRVLKDHAEKGRVLVAIRAKGKTKDVVIVAKSKR